jgi:hypothetical protein
VYGLGWDGSGSIQEERAESNRDFGVVCVNIYTHTMSFLYMSMSVFVFFVLSDYYYGHSLLTVLKLMITLASSSLKRVEVFVPPSTLSLP